MAIFYDANTHASIQNIYEHPFTAHSSTHRPWTPIQVAPARLTHGPLKHIL